MTIEMDSMQVLAPAKINLSLRVLNKRPDSFHEIETVIAPISLADQIDIERAENDDHYEIPLVPPAQHEIRASLTAWHRALDAAARCSIA